ncbi:hypothetical protein V7159_24785 [Priestia megaterium]|uniref:hypothetical protein n=1 Tax=Priestia megaterium TaxID=1404 RepID=UPI003008C56D
MLYKDSDSVTTQLHIFTNKARTEIYYTVKGFSQPLKARKGSKLWYELAEMLAQKGIIVEEPPPKLYEGKE